MQAFLKKKISPRSVRLLRCRKIFMEAEWDMCNDAGTLLKVDREWVDAANESTTTQNDAIVASAKRIVNGAVQRAMQRTMERVKQDQAVHVHTETEMTTFVTMQEPDLTFMDLLDECDRGGVPVGDGK